ncbi:MAG: glycosyltransferase family 4 protein [Anaerolineae bacterium]|nr:glycosyltransferase family 4 protein [Anaerolineae bacterium]
MRIAHVTATFPPHYTGTGIVCYHNALGLARMGYDVTVLVAGKRPDAYAYPAELTVRHLPALLRLGNAPLAPGLLKPEGFDLVHLHYPFYFGAEMVFLRSLLDGLPYVVTYHQDVLFAGPLRVPEALHHRLVGLPILRRARRVLATSWDYARASRQQALMDRPGLLGVLPNGVDGQRFHPAVEERGLRARYGIGAEERVVLFVGGLDQAHYFKGVDVLLQALARLPGDVRLLVMGDGNLRPSYQALAARLGIAERATFCGRVSDEALPAHYALCDLLALPSTTMGEAFGLVLLEAMACGKPVVASNLPGVRSVVSDGEDGLLVEPGSVDDLAARLQELLDQPQRRREMGQHGRAKVEQTYDWSRITPRLAQIYGEVLADG